MPKRTPKAPPPEELEEETESDEELEEDDGEEDESDDEAEDDAEDESEDEAEDEGEEEPAPEPPPAAAASSPYLHHRATEWSLYRSGDKTKAPLAAGSNPDGSDQTWFPVEAFTVEGIRARWGAGDYRVVSRGRKRGGGVHVLGDRHLPISAAPPPPLGRATLPRPARRTLARAPAPTPGYGGNMTLARGIGGPIAISQTNAELLGMMQVAYEWWGSIHNQAHADADARRARDDERRDAERAVDLRRLELEHDAREKERDRAYRLELARIRAGEGDDDEEDDDEEEGEQAPAAAEGAPAEGGAAQPQNIHVERGFGDQIAAASEGIARIADSVEKVIMALPEGLRMLASTALEAKAVELKAKISGQPVANGAAHAEAP